MENRAQRHMLREVQLIWRFNRGHPDALRDIYEGHKHQLVTLAAALLLDKAEAEDVVHDVFVGFMRSGGRFRLTGSLKGFLATCVANRARNQNNRSGSMLLTKMLPLNLPRRTTSGPTWRRCSEKR